MNILFILINLDLGGLEVVTATLANKFSKEGHNVHVFAFEQGNGLVKKYFEHDIDVIIAGQYKLTNNNIRLLRSVLIKNDIRIIVNQWGHNLIPVRTLNKAKMGLDTKVIAVYHNDPLKNGYIEYVNIEISKEKSLFRFFYLQIKRIIYRYVAGFSMRYNYKHCDIYEVLSSSYVCHFKKFIWLSNTPHLVVLSNPVTISVDGYVYQSKLKEREIVYVGRLEFTQKRVNRILEVWEKLQAYFPEWRLTIVGDGNDRKRLERLAANMNCSRVYFEGFQTPRPYYERASILLLTSEYEGFPLVLAECMSFGVVPVVYGSFSAVNDIIDDGKNGIIIPHISSGFNSAMMAEKVQELMTDTSRLNQMAIMAIEKSKEFSIEKIYEEWMKIML